VSDDGARTASKMQFAVKRQDWPRVGSGQLTGRKQTTSQNCRRVNEESENSATHSNVLPSIVDVIWDFELCGCS
jgi:hypothetical protein